MSGVMDRRGEKGLNDQMFKILLLVKCGGGGGSMDKCQK